VTGLAFPKPEPREKKRRHIPRSNKGGRLIKRAENACSRLTEKRAGGTCECCGRRGNQTAHGFGKQAHPEVRFDGRNLFWVCNDCHRRGESDRAWWRKKMRRILGPGQYNELYLRVVFGHMDDPRDVLAAASAGRFLVERS
jgi:hypothetical protein